MFSYGLPASSVYLRLPPQPLVNPLPQSLLLLLLLCHSFYHRLQLPDARPSTRLFDAANACLFGIIAPGQTMLSHWHQNPFERYGTEAAKVKLISARSKTLQNAWKKATVRLWPSGTNTNGLPGATKGFVSINRKYTTKTNCILDNIGIDSLKL